MHFGTAIGTFFRICVETVLNRRLPGSISDLLQLLPGPMSVDSIIPDHLLVLFREEEKHLCHKFVDVHGDSLVTLFLRADVQPALVFECYCLFRMVHSENLAIVKVACGKVFRGAK